ncbi:MAG: phosphohydrolase [Chloroflexi bacterium]|nr:phosphohydrolase [Chloroflexota bacterium]
MDTPCPGQDCRFERLEFYECPMCGTDAMIFSDEDGVKCCECDNFIKPQDVRSCISWCIASRACVKR